MRSVSCLADAPADFGNEVAFVGRSNAGKSSAINKITGVAGLARVSKTPGRTQQLVYFEVEPDRRLVDLPGYGFADVPDSVRQEWGAMLDEYFSERESLRGLMLIVDARRGIVDLDRNMIDWCARSDIPVYMLLTKADKLGREQMHKVLRATKEEVGDSVQLFSAVTGEGVAAAVGRVMFWLNTKFKKEDPGTEGADTRGQEQ